MTNTLYNILVVDDDDDFRDIIKEYILNTLKRANIIQAPNGYDALALARNQKFDLVISDMTMPRMDGKTLISELGLLPSDTRPKGFFLISGHIEEEPTLKRMGTVTFFPKPLNEANFAIQLREHFNIPQPEGPAVPPPKKNKVDITIINPFIEATLQVLSITAGIVAKKEKVFIRSSEQISGDISSLIAMNSAQYMGSFAISFEEKLFLAIVQGMLGEVYSTVTTEIQDAAAEICNQIFGVAKKVLNEKGHTIQPAIPTVIYGKGHTLKHPVGGICIAVAFSTPAGNFQVEAVLVEK